MDLFQYSEFNAIVGLWDVDLKGQWNDILAATVKDPTFPCRLCWRAWLSITGKDFKCTNTVAGQN